MKLTLVDDVDRFWTWWTTWWNVAWGFVSAGVAAVMVREETRNIVLGWLNLTPEQILVLVTFSVPAIPAGALVLRRIKQGKRPDPSPETQPDWKAIDSTESPTVPMTDAQTRQVNPGVGANRR
jgi:hypothetical protein